MGRIFKYELRRRRNTIFILSGIMIALSIVTLILMLTGKIFTPYNQQHSSFSLWIVLTFLSLSMIPIISFFTCSNGHVDELLYKDTNYLMLSIPVKSYEIIGGRILAGFVEFLIYSVISFVFMLIFVATQIFNVSVFNAENGMYVYKNLDILGNMVGTTPSFFTIFGKILYNIFVLNIMPLLYFLLSIISIFLLVGTVFMCVKALTRSFIRKKFLGQIVTIILLVLIYDRIIRFGMYLSRKWALVQYIDLKFLQFQNGMYTVQTQAIPVFLVTTIFTLVIAVAFFFLTAWLFDKKVEL